MECHRALYLHHVYPYADGTLFYLPLNPDESRQLGVNFLLLNQTRQNLLLLGKSIYNPAVGN